MKRRCIQLQLNQEVSYLLLILDALLAWHIRLQHFKGKYKNKFQESSSKILESPSTHSKSFNHQFSIHSTASIPHEPIRESTQSLKNSSIDTSLMPSLEKFYTRSSSLTIPGIYSCHDAIKNSVEQDIPLVDNPNLLIPENRPDQIFIKFEDYLGDELQEMLTSSATKHLQFNSKGKLTDTQLHKSVSQVQKLNFNWISRWKLILQPLLEDYSQYLHPLSPLKCLVTYKQLCKNLQNKLQRNFIDTFPGKLNLKVDRANPVASFTQLVEDKLNSSDKSFKKRMYNLEFLGEEGEGIGVLSEFIVVYFEKLKADKVLVSNLSDEQTLFMVPNVELFAGENLGNDHQKLFHSLGCLLAIALITNNLIPIRFTRIFIKLLLHKKIHFQDLAFEDRQKFETMRQSIYENNLGRPGLEDYNDRACYEVIEQEYVKPFVKISEQIREGMLLILDESILSEFSPETFSLRRSKIDIILEISRLLARMETRFCQIFLTPFFLFLSGQIEINTQRFIQDIEFYCSVEAAEIKLDPNDVSLRENYQKYYILIDWLLEIISEMTKSQQSNLLKFWTSSPFEPLKWNPKNPSIKFTKLDAEMENSEPRNREASLKTPLPTSNTCINRISMPCYDSKQVMQEKLLTAITECKNFGFA